MSYQRITLEEREEIFRLRYLEHLIMKQIGEKLGRDKSSISRELKRGKIIEMTLIDGRPAEVEGRENAGRREGNNRLEAG
jgi:IS30 family transposase